MDGRMDARMDAEVEGGGTKQWWQQLPALAAPRRQQQQHESSSMSSSPLEESGFVQIDADSALGSATMSRSDTPAEHSVRPAAALDDDDDVS